MCTKVYFSVTVKRNQIKLGMFIAPDNGSFNPDFGQSSSFGFGVINVYAWPIAKLSRIVTHGKGRHTCMYISIHKLF